MMPILTIVIVTALSTKAFKSKLLFVNIISPPTHTASMYTGKVFTNHAANGAATTPPKAKAATSAMLI